MPTPYARICLDGNRSNRGSFASTADLRAVSAHVIDDVAQVYAIKRLYKYDPASTSADDDDLVIKPNDVVGSGRWVSTTSIKLSAALSTPGAPSAVITNWTWVLVSEPSLGASPSPALTGAGDSATLYIPDGVNWRSGGIMVFLQVKDSDGNESLNNPYSPLLNQDALFKYIVATENLGLEIPPAGARNWQTEFLQAMRKLDSAIATAISFLPGSSFPTLLNKSMHPAAPTVGNDAVVSGITLADAPAGASYVRVFVNNVAYELGNGVTTKACYFNNPSFPAPAGVRLISNLQAGDQFVWNGLVAGFDLTTNDVIEFDYMKAV